MAIVAFVCVAGAQDLITKKNGEDIQAKILEVNTNDVRYKRWDNMDGPIFSLRKSEILLVRYENGQNEVFRTSPYLAYDEYRAVPDGIQPGMKYRHYRKLYRASDYVPMAGDRYYPVWGGVASFFIPGLGQMVNGEIGRGFAWLGGYVGCWVVCGVGVGVASSSYRIDDDIVYYNQGAAIAGSVMMFVGALGALGVNIASIVDGVRVGKIKNMYNRDVRNMSGLDIKLNPYFASVSGVEGLNVTTPVAGLSLTMKF